MTQLARPDPGLIERLQAPATAAALVAALAGPVACDTRPEGAAGAPAVRDSAGIRIVDVAARVEELPVRSLEAAPELVLGDGGPDGVEFYRVAGVAHLSDGTVVVADNGSRQLRFFGPDGRRLWDVGGRGGGPGEFEQIDGLFKLVGDSVAAWDPRQYRLTVWGPDGRLVRTVHPTPPPAGSFFPVLGVLNNGSFLAGSGLDIGSVFSQGTGVRQPSTTVVRYGPDGARMDTLGRYPADEQFVWVNESGFSLRRLPFGKRLLIAVGGDRVYVMSGAHYEVLGLTPAGRTELILRRTENPIPVVEEDIQRYRDRRLEEAGDEERAAEERRLASLEYPTHKAPVTDLVATAQDSLWVREADRGPSRTVTWTVYGPDGLPTAKVRSPAGLRIRSVDTGRVLGIESDDLGREMVVVYRIAP